MRPDLHRQQRLQSPAELARVQPELMAEDHARTAQPRHPVQTRRRRDPDLRGEIAVGGPGVVLQKPQQMQVDRIQYDRFSHWPNVTRVFAAETRPVFSLPPMDSASREAYDGMHGY